MSVSIYENLLTKNEPFRFPQKNIKIKKDIDKSVTNVNDDIYLCTLKNKPKLFSLLDINDKMISKGPTVFQYKKNHLKTERNVLPNDSMKTIGQKNLLMDSSINTKTISQKKK